jgi:hypothetical protein
VKSDWGPTTGYTETGDYFRLADQPPKRRIEARLARTDLLIGDLEVLR